MTALQRNAASRAARCAWTYLLVAFAAVVLSCDKGVVEPVTGSVARVVVAPATATIQVGTTLQVRATPQNSAGEELGGRRIFWDTENAAVATVSDDGVVTGVAPGTTRIGASVEGTSEVVTITVTDQPVAAIVITPNIATVGVRASVDLVAVTLDAQGGALPGRQVEWTSSDTTIATVNSGGRVTGVAPGNVVITAASEGRSETAAVTVTAAPVASVVVSPTAASLTTGQTTQLASVVRDQSGVLLSDRLPTWTSSDEGIATVSSTGLVTGAGAGTASIVATVDGVSDTATVTVVAVPVSAVVVSPASSSVVVGGTVQLAATPVNAQGAVLVGRQVTWATRDAAVARVDANTGVVTGVAAGSVTITATSEGKTGAATVTVSNVPVATLVLTPATASVMVGDSVRLTAEPRAANGTVLPGRSITWQSSNNAVATVSSKGWVVGVGAGSAIITATSEGKSDQSTVTVTRQPVATITIDPSAFTVTVGQTSQLAATLRDAKGNVLTGRTITWSSSRTTVATVGSSTGLVSGVSVGTATITATSEGKSATAAATVQAAPVSAVIVSPANPSLYVGETRQLSVQVTDANGETVSSAGTTWATSNAAVATVSASGLVTAVGPGSADITATNAGKSGRTTVTVLLVPVATVSVTPSPASVVIGSTLQLTATPRDADGGVLSGRSVTWSSNDPDVATVNPSSGVVTGVLAGSAVITATIDGRSGSTAVTVTRPPVARVEISPATATLTVGESGQFNVALLDAQGGSIDTAGRTIIWDSSNDNVVLVTSRGLATARAAGTARIVVASEGKADTATVTVVAVPVASVSVTPASATITAGETVDFDAQPRDAGGNALTGRDVSWTSSNTAVATVSSTGLVTAVSVGSATIVATSEGVAGNATVTVTVVPVAKVVVTPSSATLTVGQRTTLTAEPQDAAGNALAGREVTWSSSNPNVATVTSAGEVTAVAPGAATITATSEGRTGTATISVSQVAVASVRVTPATLAVDVGRTGQFLAEPLDAAGNVLTGRVVVWTSANESVATVGDDDGVVTGVAPGTATIRATSEGKTGTASVTVNAVAVSAVTVSPSTADLVVGESLQLTAVTEDAAGNVLADRAIAWTTSDDAVATVSPTESATVLLTALAAGNATITATSEGKRGTSAITVSPVPVASVALSPSVAEVEIGRTVQLTAQPRDAGGNALDGRDVGWSSSNPELATVDQQGLVTGVAEGVASITATSEGQSGAATVTVMPPPVSSVAVAAPATSLMVGGMLQLTATPRDANGAPLRDRDVGWQSTDEQIALVDGWGLVSGVREGRVTIVATSEGKSGTAALDVLPPPAARIALSPGKLKLDVAERRELRADVYDAAGVKLLTKQVRWRSSNDAVARVSDDGVVTGVSKGKTEVIATVDGVSDSTQVEVNE